jgi:hypothetical protein
MDKEAIARIVHGAMRWAADNSCTDKHPEWQGGNSFAEDEARKAATAILATLSPAEPSEAKPAIERLVAWAKQHSNVTPLDGTDRDSPTFGDLRAAIRALSAPAHD